MIHKSLRHPPKLVFIIQPGEVDEVKATAQDIFSAGVLDHLQLRGSIADDEFAGDAVADNKAAEV